MKNNRKVVLLLIALITLVLSASWLVAGRLLEPVQYFISKPNIGLPIESISLPSKSGSTISGWHIRSQLSKGVVVLLHGIRANRLDMLDRARFLSNEGYSIVMIDLQAHGESKGESITLGYLEKFDVEAAITFARKVHPQEPVGVIGVSLGAASAVLASPLNVDALILESMYPDIKSAIYNRVRTRLGVFATLPAELLLAQLGPRLGILPSDLRPIDLIKHVGSPVYIISGTFDTHTKASESHLLFDLAPNPKEIWLVEGAGHVDLYEFSGGAYADSVLRFLKKHMQDKD